MTVDELPLYALVYHPGPNYNPAVPPEQQLPDHAAYIASLRQQGILRQGKPFRPKVPSYPVVEVHNEAEAEGILHRDPAVARGALVGAVYRWHPKYSIYPPL